MKLILLLILLITLYILLSKNNEHFSNIKNSNVIMTTYFCNKKDPQRKKKAPCDDITYIKPWYYSIKKLGLNGIVFHDGLSDNFVKQYETNRIKFFYVNSNEYDLSLNDLRYFVYYDYIKKHKNIKNIFMTDGNDVTIVKNPFTDKLLTKICVGKELNLIGENKWMIRKINQFNQSNKDKFVYDKSYSTYSAGILGGRRRDVLNFLSSMIKIFENFNSKQRKENLNMIVFNYVIYNKFNEDVISGEDLHSKYKKYENHRKDIYFIHK